MIIKEIEVSELYDLLALYDHLHEFDCPLPEKKYVEATWREIQESPWFKCFGVYINETLVTSCVLTVIPNLTHGCKKYGVIENWTFDKAQSTQPQLSKLKHGIDGALEAI